MARKRKTWSGEYVPKSTKKEVLGFIQSYYIKHDSYPTVDDIAGKLGRPRKIVADYVSLYARYGILQAFKEQGEDTKYGPGINWEKVDYLKWEDFFRAGNCPHCGHKGVLGFKTSKIIRYTCKWCNKSWDKSIECADKKELDDIEQQAGETRSRWARPAPHGTS